MIEKSSDFQVQSDAFTVRVHTSESDLYRKRILVFEIAFSDVVYRMEMYQIAFSCVYSLNRFVWIQFGFVGLQVVPLW